MAFRSVSKGNVILSGNTGDGTPPLDVRGMSEVRGQVDIDVGVFDASCRVAYEFSVAETPGKWIERSTSDRIAAEGASASPIDCRGFAWARLRVVVVSGTSPTTGRITLSGYAPYKESAY